MRCQLLSTSIRFVAAVLAIFGSVALADAAAAQAPRPTVTFVNNSGHSALVKLVGVSEQTVEVPDGERRTVSAAGGTYYILTRYGDSRDAFTYSRGSPFVVTESSERVSVITITLHRVVNGNYGTHPVSAQEFALGGRA